MGGRSLSCKGSGPVEEATRPPRSFRRARTLPPGLDLPSEDGGGRRLVANLLRHHHSDESDYKLRQPLLGRGSGSGSSSGYTSLRDLLPSPSPASSPVWPPEGEISIRNRLVKQAAYAYLQPMGSMSPKSPRRRGCLRRLGCGAVADGCAMLLAGCLLPAIKQAFARLLAPFRRKGGAAAAGYGDDVGGRFCP